MACNHLLDLLKPYVQGSGTRVLEMFARYTPAGYSEEEEDSLWFSVGNEPLKYNEVEARWEGGQDGQCGTQGERLPTRPTPS